MLLGLWKLLPEFLTQFICISQISDCDCLLLDGDRQNVHRSADVDNRHWSQNVPRIHWEGTNYQVSQYFTREIQIFSKTYMCLTIHTICWISKAGKDAESISESKAMLEDRNYVKVGFIWFHSFSIDTTGLVKNIIYTAFRRCWMGLRDGTILPSRY